MELIEREALREKAIECGKLAKQDPRLLVVGLGYVLDAPAIDAAPVVHGRWDFVTDYTSRCTNCCEIQWIDHDKEPRYCTTGGAQMDGGEGHE